MKLSARGRILFWRHGSLWIGLGGEPAGFHSHHAVQISLPFPQCRVRLQSPANDWQVFTAAIVAANASHAFEARDQYVAQIFLDPESTAGKALQLRYQQQGIEQLDVVALKPLIVDLAAAYESRASDAKLIALAQSVIDVLAGATKSAKAPDARITLAVDLMRKRLDKPVSLNSIAEAVHLSPSRFRHLFIAETGVGFRSYLLWLRLERSLTAYVEGSSLTDAAYAGGFADSAHFSRTFRKMFGIAPASVRPE